MCVGFFIYVHAITGVGFTSEMLAEKYYRYAVFWGGYVGYNQSRTDALVFSDAKIGKIYEGTDNIQLQTIAKLEQLRMGFA